MMDKQPHTLLHSHRTRSVCGRGQPERRCVWRSAAESLCWAGPTTGLCLSSPPLAAVCSALSRRRRAEHEVGGGAHVWLLGLALGLFLGESLALWAAQCVWTGTPPGRHTQSGSVNVLWHSWHPFFSDTKTGPPRYFSCGNTKSEAILVSQKLFFIQPNNGIHFRLNWEAVTHKGCKKYNG